MKDNFYCVILSAGIFLFAMLLLIGSAYVLMRSIKSFLSAKRKEN